MHTLNRQPGKFEANRSHAVARVVYDISLDGCCDDFGEADGFGYYAFVVGKRYGFIMCEDSNGFVSVDYYPLAEARRRWEEIQDEYNDYMARHVEEFC